MTEQRIVEAPCLAARGGAERRRRAADGAITRAALAPTRVPLAEHRRAGHAGITLVVAGAGRAGPANAAPAHLGRRRGDARGRRIDTLSWARRRDVAHLACRARVRAGTPAIHDAGAAQTHLARARATERDARGRAPASPAPRARRRARRRSARPCRASTARRRRRAEREEDAHHRNADVLHARRIIEVEGPNRRNSFIWRPSSGCRRRNSCSNTRWSRRA